MTIHLPLKIRLKFLLLGIIYGPYDDAGVDDPGRIVETPAG